MSSIICSVRGCHNNWKKRRVSLEQQCYEHNTKRSECCGAPYNLHPPPSKEEDLRLWLKALNLKHPPKRPYVCSYHFVERKPTPEHPYPEKWLGYDAPVKRTRRVFVRLPASVSEMSSGVQSQAVKAAAEGKDKVKEHKAMTDIKPDDGKKSAVQPLMLSPELLSGHGEFACSVCSETFFSLAQLAKHVQFHDQDRPFPCVICGKRFLSRSHHAEHQRVHTRERPFPCNRCERAFTTHHNLKRHQLIHDKEEMYRCTVCGVLFCQEHQLGNIKSIIRVLKQHNVDELIDPQELSELEPLPEQKPAVETLPNLKLTTVFKEEQKTSRNRRKHKPLHLEDEQSPFAEREEKPSQLSYHSEGPQILRGKEKDFTDLVKRAGPKIQKIAYDIEIIV